ncbi:low temperature requirement protein A [Paracoccus aurantiacus]|uniref:Low temperature requirement protein A n=1 Tax=Paracoccus aurantiacus TaxID=2599412 RepID=A0A5C6S5Q2_9RHOB|nr:low temperature requirement protein A [Paracoccus aurantiacus]TXB69759.1 low temperature requirement protein A [Paracoccus aurantiacus]
MNERARQTDETREDASPIELFFDLVFVFAFIQLSHHLAAHLNWHGLAETAIMLVAVLTVWSGTSWSATIVRDSAARPTLVVLLIMVLGLMMNAAISHAFDKHAWAFIIPLLLIEIGRTLWTIAFAPDSDYRNHFIRALGWMLFCSLLWVAGALLGPDGRLIAWGIAAATGLAGIWTGHPLPGRRLHSEAMPFDAAHFLERCSLFLLIALGETVISTGFALAESGLSARTVFAGFCAFLGTTAMWAIIFGVNLEMSEEHMKEASDQVRIGRAAVNSVTLMVAGLILSAVANQVLIADTYGEAEISHLLPLVAGPVIFLLGHYLYMRITPDFRARRHIIGMTALAVGGVAATALPALAGLALITAVMVMIALFDRTKLSDLSSSD